MSRILAVDYGDMRTGLAVSDPLGLLASAAGVVTGTDPGQVADRVVAEAVQRGAAVILLGLPKNMTNTLGPRAEKTLAFAELLRIGRSPAASLLRERPDIDLRELLAEESASVP